MKIREIQSKTNDFLLPVSDFQSIEARGEIASASGDKSQQQTQYSFL